MRCFCCKNEIGEYEDYLEIPAVYYNRGKSGTTSDLENYHLFICADCYYSRFLSEG